jgi:hypothetical protein
MPVHREEISHQRRIIVQQFFQYSSSLPMVAAGSASRRIMLSGFGAHARGTMLGARISARRRIALQHPVFESVES